MRWVANLSELDSKYCEGKIRYKFDKYWLLAGLLAFFALPSLYLLFELFSHGFVWLSQVGAGRRKVPNWVTISIGWALFIYILWVFILPAIGAIVRGYVLIFDGDTILVGGVKIGREAIEGSGADSFRGRYLLFRSKRVYTYTHFSSGATDALDAFLELR